MGVHRSRPYSSSHVLSKVQDLATKVASESLLNDAARVEIFAAEASRWVHTGSSQDVQPWQRGSLPFLNVRDLGAIMCVSHGTWTAFHCPDLTYTLSRSAVKAWPEIWQQPSISLYKALRSIDVHRLNGWQETLIVALGLLYVVALQSQIKAQLTVVFAIPPRKFSTSSVLLGDGGERKNARRSLLKALNFVPHAIQAAAQELTRTLFLSVAKRDAMLRPLPRSRCPSPMSKPQPPRRYHMSCWSPCASAPQLSKCTEILMHTDHPTERPGVRSPGANVVPGVSLDSVRWRAAQAVAAQRTFYSRREFPAIAELVEQMAGDLAAEFEELWRDHQQDFLHWQEDGTKVKGWRLFGTHLFGHRLETNCQRAPIATAFAEAVPGVTLCGFSVLQPGTYIAPHAEEGESSAMRLHVGLRVPEGGRCGLRVGTQVHVWQEGVFVAFDPTADHEAWNFADGLRAVLLLDFGAKHLPRQQWPEWLQRSAPPTQPVEPVEDSDKEDDSSDSDEDS